MAMPLTSTLVYHVFAAGDGVAIAETVSLVAFLWPVL